MTETEQKDSENQFPYPTDDDIEELVRLDEKVDTENSVVSQLSGITQRYKDIDEKQKTEVGTAKIVGVGEVTDTTVELLFESTAGTEHVEFHLSETTDSLSIHDLLARTGCSKISDLMGEELVTLPTGKDIKSRAGLINSRYIIRRLQNRATILLVKHGFGGYSTGNGVFATDGFLSPTRKGVTTSWCLSVLIILFTTFNSSIIGSSQLESVAYLVSSLAVAILTTVWLFFGTVYGSYVLFDK